MGQYYTPTFIDKNDNVQTLYSHDFGSGLKLMEHSWIGNQFANAGISLIKDSPKRVAWIGDYSDEPCRGSYLNGLSPEEFMNFYEKAMRDTGRVDANNFTNNDKDILDDKNPVGYFINHTKKTYIDISEYYEQNKFRYDDDDPKDEFWCVNPLPVLTACGNGRGGGDYRDDEDINVGSWAFDLIEYSLLTSLNEYSKSEFKFRDR